MMNRMKKVKELTTRFVGDYAWRAAILISASILADAAFFLYYTISFFLSDRDLWCFFMLFFYFTLALARVTLFLLYRKDAGREEHEYSFVVTAGTSLCVLGLEICALAVSAYLNGTLISLSNATVITNAVLAIITNGFLYNAIRFVVKFIAPFTGRRHMKKQTVQSEFFRCKKYLSRAESLFMFMLLLNRIIARANVEMSPALLIVHLVAFLLTGVYAIAAGTMLLLRARKRRMQTEKSVPPPPVD